FNRHPSHIYTHYFYFKSCSIDPERYLLARLIDSTTIDSALAVYNCIASEIARSANHRLTRAIILNWITGISIHNIRSYIESNEPLKIYRADLEGLRAAALSKYVICEPAKHEYILSVADLSVFVQKASRGTLYVDIPSDDKRQDRIRIRAQYLAEA